MSAETSGGATGPIDLREFLRAAHGGSAPARTAPVWPEGQRAHAPRWARVCAALIAGAILLNAVPSPSASSVEPAGDDPAVAGVVVASTGSPLRPLPAGTPVSTTRWEVTLGEVEWSADQLVAQATYIPLSPPEGWHWALLRMQVRNLTASTADAGLISAAIVSPGYEISDRRAGGHQPAQTIPGALDRIGIAGGELRAGNLGFLLPADAGEDCLVRLTIAERPGDDGRPFWFACG